MPPEYNQFRNALAVLCGKPFGKPVVCDGVRTRSLRFDAFGIQSSMRKGDPFELELAYTRAMMIFQLFHPAPRDILIVGLGGGSLSKYCFHRFPSARVTTVEIDERVIALREQFFIPPDSERFQIVHADAAEYLSGNMGVADVVLLDGFDASGLPAALSSQCFYDSCHAALRDEGVFVANLLNNDLLLAAYLERMRWACGGKLFHTTAEYGSNVIAVGLRQETVPGWHDLHARAKAIATSLGADLRHHLKNMERHHRERATAASPSFDTLAVHQHI